jgi:hypothetical protein
MIISVSAEQLIALEAAVAELGSLYTVARSFTALRQRAETVLLPRVASLGAQLRHRVRHLRLSDDELDIAAREIVALGSEWRCELERVHASPVYQQALQAFAQERQDELRELLPRIFADMHVVSPAPSLYFPISPSSGRQRAGSSHFLSAEQCADKLSHTLAAGLTPDEGGAEWWERELPFIGCADTAAALESPIALRLAAADVHVAVFAGVDGPTYRIFTARLRASMSIVLAAEANDEWWEAYEESYRDFRGALQRELGARGYEVATE